MIEYLSTIYNTNKYSTMLYDVTLYSNSVVIFYCNFVIEINPKICFSMDLILYYTDVNFIKISMNIVLDN